MIIKVMMKLLTAMISSLVLLGIGLVIWYFKRETQTSLTDILFWVGVVPIAFFSIGLAANFSGRGNFHVQFSRSVSNQSSKERSLQDANEMKSNVVSGLNWVMAGLIVWLIMVFI
jgi:uncharacterized membrane protein YeiB